jgi:polar amino acid transport system substrate-binding protein
MKTLLSAMLLAAVVALSPLVAARSLDAIRQRGTIEQCAHPNALPFASRRGEMQGFQIELGQALAKQLGVALEPIWIIGPGQIRRVGCDIVTDAIDDPDAQEDSGLQLSKPYYRTGIVLAVPQTSPITNVGNIDPHAKIGVMVGSVASVELNQHGLITSTFGFEDDMLQALAGKEIEAAAISRAAVGYFNTTHPGQTMRTVEIDAVASAFSWNVAVGMLKPDDKLRAAIDAALDRLTADGTVRRIYARYGMTLQTPQ